MKKKAKAAPKKAAKKPAVKAKKAVAKKSSSATGKKSPAKTIKKTATKKTVLKGKKSAASAKSKSGVKTGSVAKAKSASVKKAQVKQKKGVVKKVAQRKEQPISTPILTHGADLHFIPAHRKELPARIEDGKKVEQLFHNKEEVALHQENQKVKANMASRMGRKRVFHTPRFS